MVYLTESQIAVWSRAQIKNSNIEYSIYSNSSKLQQVNI